MAKSTIVDSRGEHFNTAEDKIREVNEQRREAMSAIMSMKKSGAKIPIAGSWFQIGDVLDLGFFLIYAGPTGRRKKKR